MCCLALALAPALALALAVDGDGDVDLLWYGLWMEQDGMLPSTSFGWAMRLDSLRRYLETGTGSPV